MPWWARDVLWVAVVLGIPASAVALAWAGLDAVRWVRHRRAVRSAGGGIPGRNGAGTDTPPRTSTPRGGGR